MQILQIIEINCPYANEFKDIFENQCSWNILTDVPQKNLSLVKNHLRKRITTSSRFH